ncbi:MAG: hypothetical protein HKN42_11715 [Granulosicoccus sp.]|nr:hypothetical protein [Granulosicoccus sp.]
MNENGEIYMASWNGYVAHHDAQGVVLNTVSLSGNLTDIDMNAAGQIVVGNRFGDVYQTDAELLLFSVFSAGSESVFVAYVPVSATNPPSLSGSHSRKGRYITTTLSWTSDAPSVDVYYNGVLIDTYAGVSTAVYRYSKKKSQVFYICNAGTDVCSEEYIAN